MFNEIEGLLQRVTTGEDPPVGSFTIYQPARLSDGRRAGQAKPAKRCRKCEPEW